jgi:hypothetical protein
MYRNRNRNTYQILIRKPEGKWSLGRPRNTWTVSIRMDLREIFWEVVDLIHLAQGRGH